MVTGISSLLNMMIAHFGVFKPAFTLLAQEETGVWGGER